jgi:hypothetical protein
MKGTKYDQSVKYLADEKKRVQIYIDDVESQLTNNVNKFMKYLCIKASFFTLVSILLTIL